MREDFARKIACPVIGKTVVMSGPTTRFFRRGTTVVSISDTVTGCSGSAACVGQAPVDGFTCPYQEQMRAAA